MRIRTTQKIAKNTYVSKNWNTNNGLIKNIFLLIFYLYKFLFQCLWFSIKWIINKIKLKKENITN